MTHGINVAAAVRVDLVRLDLEARAISDNVTRRFSADDLDSLRSIQERILDLRTQLGMIAS